MSEAVECKSRPVTTDTCNGQRWLYFVCPHCESGVVMLESEIACRRAIHAVLRDSFQQVNPHAPRSLCEQLLKENKVFGCCRSIEIVGNEVFARSYES